MSDKILFAIGNMKFSQKTILTILGVGFGIYVIKKISEDKNPTTLVVEGETSGFANYVDEGFFNYVDEGFMGMGGDESMKFGGGKPIAFASANGTDSAIYEPNFYNSNGKVPIATDEPNFANGDGNPFLKPTTKKRQDLVGGGSQQQSDNMRPVPAIDKRKGKTKMQYGDRGRISG